MYNTNFKFCFIGKSFIYEVFKHLKNVSFLSSVACGGIWTPDLRVMSQVFYHDRWSMGEVPAANGLEPLTLGWPGDCSATVLPQMFQNKQILGFKNVFKI